MTIFAFNRVGLFSVMVSAMELRSKDRQFDPRIGSFFVFCFVFVVVYLDFLDEMLGCKTLFDVRLF